MWCVLLPCACARFAVLFCSAELALRSTARLRTWVETAPQEAITCVLTAPRTPQHKYVWLRGTHALDCSARLQLLLLLFLLLLLLMLLFLLLSPWLLSLLSSLMLHLATCASFAYCAGFAKRVPLVACPGPTPSAQRSTCPAGCTGPGASWTVGPHTL